MNVLEKLYPYQREAVTTTFYNPKGIVCLPTGTGKTFAQAAMIANDIIMNPNQFRMYVVNAPRILLTFQLLKETYFFLTSNNIDARYMFVHTGGSANESELEEIRVQSNLDGNNIPFSEIEASTSVEEIKKMMEKAKEQDMPIVFFSTYNSAQKIEIARQGFRQPITLVVNDEAHYLVQEQFHNILHDLRSSRCYFFTATLINTPSDRGRGMNNNELYGEILYQMTPRQAIDLGKMVRPRIHIVTTHGVYDTDDYNKSLNLIIKNSFEQHEKALPILKPKILVSVKGTQDIKSFLGSKEYNDLREQGVDIYAVASSEEIGNDINGAKVRRQDFLKSKKNPKKQYIT